MKRRAFIRTTAQSAVAFGIFRRMECAGVPRGADSEGRFSALRDQYFLRLLAYNPVTSTYLGGDGYNSVLSDANGRLRDWREASLDGERAFYREVRAQLGQIDSVTLGDAGRIDHAVMTTQLAFLQHQMEDLRTHERVVDTYVAEPFRGVDWQLQQMQDVPGGLAGTPEEWDLVVRRVSAIPAYLDAAKANLLAGKEHGNLPDRRMVQRDGIAGSRANADYFGTTLPATAATMLGSRNFAADLLSRLQRVSGDASSSFQAFAVFLGATFDVNEKVDRFAAGEREYEYRVRTFLRDERSAEQLWDYGAAQVAMYEEKLYAAAQVVADSAGLGTRFDTPEARRSGVRAVMDFLGHDSPRDDDELFRWYREAGARAIAYGRAQAMFDVPVDYTLDVQPTPLVLRNTIEAAYYAAPPFKRTGAGRFYLTPTGNDPAALKLNDRASVADTAVHEGFPGHDWHFRYMTEHALEISNIRWLTPGSVEDSSSMWEDSMATEGWGLYSEELMAEPSPGEGHAHGFYSPAEYLYEVQGQLLRAVRVRLDVGLHTGRLSFDQAVDYYTEHVSFASGACGHTAGDPHARALCDEAQRAVYRYSKWPTQAITYNLGKNAIVALRDESRKRAGAAFSLKEFHERLMRMGTIPAGYFTDSFLRESTT